MFGKDQGIRKVSVRDIAHAVATGVHGATTVASTMRIAALAGIRLFVTGGLGGVHQGAESSMDVSADLTELSRTEVAVVSAGVKSILDIGRTLEVLETLEVPVVGYGTDEFPSFFSRSSGLAVPMRVDTPEEAARLMRASFDLGVGTGISIANPVPAEDEMARDDIDGVIARALAECAEQGVTGKDITPFLLGRLVELSEGRSLETNLALVRNNARVGTAIAVAFAAL
jgi:pseudouridine-5'-phosphate glycosidase